MPNLSLTLPGQLLDSLQQAAQQRDVPLDSLAGAILGDWSQGARHRLFQIATSVALIEGAFQEGISSHVLTGHGDFGLGTFANLDGEMAILDGVIYQIRGDGAVLARTDDFPVPFAAVSNFEPEQTFEAKDISALDDLKRACDPHRESENLFYAIRVDGIFQTVHARAVCAVGPDAKGGLAAAAKNAAEFHFRDVEGTLVCLWSPKYSKSFNIPGYHCHFLSRDRTHGGHVMDCSARSLQVGVQTLCDYDVQLPERGAFLTADLTKDPSAVLGKAE